MKYKTYKELTNMMASEIIAYYNIKNNMSVNDAKERLWHLRYELQMLSCTDAVLNTETCLQNALNNIGSVIKELEE